MGKVVPCLIPYKSIFYLKKLSRENQFLIESNLVWFENPGLIAKRHYSLGPGLDPSVPSWPTFSTTQPTRATLLLASDRPPHPPHQHPC
jgi:hypothetical protein